MAGIYCQRTTCTMMLASPSSKLRAVKTVHTVVWAFFASAIVLIPVHAALGNLRVAMVLIGVVSAECIILLFNRMSCPLTPVAARYTDDRAANFDIYLPRWLARYNKAIFGTIYVLGILYVAVLWGLR